MVGELAHALDHDEVAAASKREDASSEKTCHSASRSKQCRLMAGGGLGRVVSQLGGRHAANTTTTTTMKMVRR